MAERLTNEILEAWVHSNSEHSEVGKMARELLERRKAEECQKCGGRGRCGAVCSGCRVAEGSQHRPMCPRQGIVTEDSDYRDQGNRVCPDCHGTGKRSTNHKRNAAGEVIDYDEVPCPNCAKPSVNAELIAALRETLQADRHLSGCAKYHHFGISCILCGVGKEHAVGKFCTANAVHQWKTIEQSPCDCYLALVTAALERAEGKRV